MDVLALIISSALIILGWGITYYLTQKSNVEDKKREVVVQHLIEAWRAIADSAYRDNSGNSHLEKAIMDIQLFGTEEQVKLAQEFALALAEGDGADAMPLVRSLRDSLRKELGITSYHSRYDVVFLRLPDKKGRQKK